MNTQQIQNRIEQLLPKMAILGAVAPLTNIPIHGYSWAEFDEAFKTSQEIAYLETVLFELQT